MLPYICETEYMRERVVQSGDASFRLTPEEKVRRQRAHLRPPAEALPAAEGNDPFSCLAWAYRQLAALTGALWSSHNNEQGFRKLAAQIIDATRQHPHATMAAMLWLPFSSYAHAHAVQVATLSARIAALLGTPAHEIETLACAALTMNIAMIELQDRLWKQHRPLSDAQIKQVRFHPIIGSAILREVGIADTRWHRLVLTHHERYNGKGYPFGLERKGIKRQAHLLHIVDTLLAWLHPRPHLPAKPPGVHVGELIRQRDQLIDPEIAEMLAREIGLFPPGSLVRREDGEIAIVIAAGDSIETPLTLPVHALASEARPTPTRVREALPAGTLKKNIAELAGLWKDL